MEGALKAKDHAMPGNFIVKASQHPFLEGQHKAAEIVQLPTLLAPQMKYCGKLRLLDTTNSPRPGIYYKIVTNAGEVLAEGITDDTGRSIVVATEEYVPVTAYIGSGGWSIEETIQDEGDECGC